MVSDCLGNCFCHFVSRHHHIDLCGSYSCRKCFRRRCSRPIFCDGDAASFPSPSLLAESEPNPLPCLFSYRVGRVESTCIYWRHVSFLSRAVWISILSIGSLLSTKL